jgi:hypothetical protein
MPSDGAGKHEWETYVMQLSRYTAVKEEHATMCEHEIVVLWSDYFKPEHVEKYPHLHDIVWTATVARSRNPRASVAGSSQCGCGTARPFTRTAARARSSGVAEREALHIGRARERFDGLTKAEAREVHPRRVRLAESKSAGFPEVPDGLAPEAQPISLVPTMSAATASVLAITSPVSTVSPPRGPVPIIAGCPTMTASPIANSRAMAAMNECTSSKKACSCRC